MKHPAKYKDAGGTRAGSPCGIRRPTRPAVFKRRIYVLLGANPCDRDWVREFVRGLHEKQTAELVFYNIPSNRLLIYL